MNYMSSCACSQSNTPPYANCCAAWVRCKDVGNKYLAAADKRANWGIIEKQCCVDMANRSANEEIANASIAEHAGNETPDLN